MLIWFHPCLCKQLSERQKEDRKKNNYATETTPKNKTIHIGLTLLEQKLCHLLALDGSQNGVVEHSHLFSDF